MRSIGGLGRLLGGRGLLLGDEIGVVGCFQSVFLVV